MGNDGEDRDALTRAVAEELSVLTVREVAALLKVKTSWVYDKVQAGEFPVLRLGRQLRFRTTDIRDYLEAHYEAASGWPHTARRNERDMRARRLGRPRRR